MAAFFLFLTKRAQIIWELEGMWRDVWKINLLSYTPIWCNAILIFTLSNYSSLGDFLKGLSCVNKLRGIQFSVEWHFKINFILSITRDIVFFLWGPYSLIALKQSRMRAVIKECILAFTLSNYSSLWDFLKG